MGGSNSTASLTMQEVKYNPDLAGYQIIGQGDTYNIWRNRTTGVEMEEYTQSSRSQNEFKYLRDVFEFRYERDYIVSSLYFKQEAQQELCSTFNRASLFLERIPLRLNEIKDLPYPDSLHLTHSCLRGFRELFERVGSFTISQHMIGINSDAVVKVWISPDFGRQRLTDFEGPRKEDEAGMVVEIMEIIDKTIDRRTQPQSITNFILRGGRPSFDQALRRFQQYGIRHVIQTPQYLKSIAQLRDRGYFKKMPPSRTSLLHHSGHSLNSSYRQSTQFQSVPQVGLMLNVDAPVNPILPIINSPAAAVRTLPIISAANIQIPISNNGFSKTPSHIGGIPVVQNPNTRVNTYYSNMPVGGSFLVNNYRTTNTLPSFNSVARPVTPSYQPIVSPKNLSSYSPPTSNTIIKPTINTIVKPSPYNSIIPTQSVYSQNNQLSQVQKIIKQIEQMKYSAIPKNETIASGYMYQSSNKPYGSLIPDTSYNPAPHNVSYIPTEEGGTNPELLRLAKQKFTKISYDDFVTTSLQSPSLLFGSGIGNNDDNIKSILKNKQDNDFSLKSFGGDFKTEYKSQIIADSRPSQSQDIRTIYNREQFSIPRQVTYMKQIEKYSASIKIHTPQDLHNHRVLMK